MSALHGKVVATTRDGGPDDRLVASLQAAGATVRVWPTVQFQPPADPGPLDRALADPTAWSWIALTSARGVHAVADRLGTPPVGPAVAVVGEATARAARRRGWPVALVGDGGGAEGLVRAMARSGDLEGVRVLFPAAAGATDALERGLGRAGADVHRVVAYRTVLAPPDPRRVRRDLARGVDVVTFASPSAVRSLARALGGDLAAALAGTDTVAIGPTTARALRRAGVGSPRVAAETSFDAVVDACVAAPLSATPDDPTPRP